ncbi:MAG: LamG-like jellyroll fold domain-containing protein [Muribaculaceae bacterium]
MDVVGGKDYEIEKEVTLNPYTLPTAPTFSYNFSNTPGNYTLTINGSLGDKFSIIGDLTGVTEFVNKTTTTREAAAINDSPKVLTINYNSKVNDKVYIKRTYTQKLPAYPWPKDFSSVFKDGAVVLSWNSADLSNETNCQVGDNYEIRRAEDADFSNPTLIATISYDKSKTSYTYTDDVSKKKFEGTYYYRIRRTKSESYWGWDKYMQTSVPVITRHKYIATSLAQMVDATNARITWTYNSDGNVWSSGTQVQITRLNETTGTSFTFSVPEDSVANCSYTEKLKTSCDVYSYQIAVIPGSNEFSQQGMQQVATKDDQAIFIAEVGEVTSVIASKGYYSDHVEIEWTCNEYPIDVFSIRVREYGTDEEFRQIDQVQANLASREYSYTDIKSIPGVIYEYQILAVTKCGTQTVSKPFSKNEIGFRTPTGDIYGRVTFESGQAVPDVEVRAEVSDGTGITGKAYRLGGSDKLVVDNGEVMKDATIATIEAWVKPEGDGVIVKKPDMYTLEYKDDHFTFTVGSQAVTTGDKVSKYTKSASFVHVSAVAGSDKIYLYVNDTIQAAVDRTATIEPSSKEVVIGEGFKGVIDDVRLWSVARDSADIARDYGRYIVGNETGLEAYYTFDYSVANEFYDISYSGIKYHKNHGTVTGAKISDEEVPTTSQLGYRSYTDTDGSYSLRSLPYKGNGTTYMVIPRLGIHQFESEKELRLLSANSQNHTVNFTDKSSFNVSGTVTYKGGTIPVEGVSFKVDGVTVMDGKNNIITTDAMGKFTISVPVGTHEVKAELVNHTFEDNGRITNLDGTDRNYQDMLTGIELFDITTVRYIGRVAGGSIQEEYEVGHSLSKNNLADSIKVTLTYQNDMHVAESTKRGVVYEHFNNPYVKGVKTNRAEFEGNTITIYPNEETGEFFVDVLPIKYRASVSAPGYTDAIPGNNEEIDFSNCFAKQYSINEYVDSVSVAGTYINRTDSVMYNQLSKFIASITPSILVKQLSSDGTAIDYFGKEKVKLATLDASNPIEVTTYDAATGTYTFTKPVFEQLENVTFDITTAQVYYYKDSQGKDKPNVPEDIVAIPEATLSFGGDLAYLDEGQTSIEDITTDENGYAQWSFRVNNPEMTAGLRSLSMKMTYGDSESPTSIDWDGKFSAIVIGARTNGSDFLTEGPDQLMFVLRDPPGSNSYSYLEKGVTVARTSTYNGEILNTFTSTATSKLGTQLLTFVGVGAGTINNTEIQKEYGFGVSHTTMIGGTDSDYKEFTTTTRFATSSDPLYVGSNGDLYVGYSTNIGIGTTENIAVISSADYNKAKDAYSVITEITPATSEYLVVKASGVSMTEKYKTMFIYPQIYIENTLIPKWEDTRNSLLHQESEGLDWQALADQTNQPVFVSKLSRDDENFGRSNTDKVFGDVEDAFNGKSYTIYFPQDAKVLTDSIHVFNQSIERWKQHIANNEQQKVNAELLTNVSFQAGANYSYSESFSTTRSETQRFSLAIGGKVFDNIGVANNKTGFVLLLEDEATTTHGGEFTGEETANHCQGFELAESGDDDYISVDICRETGYNKDDQYIKYDDMNDSSTQFSTFIFKTKGGATSCPYEGKEYTRYYLPGQKVLNESTVQIEVPEISVENDFIQNVPSGKSAYFTLYLRNNSEAQEDGWFDLRIDDESNPDGAQLYIDGAPLGSSGGRAFLVPAGSTLTKTLEVRKGKVMNYDNLRLLLQSQCQCDPTDFLDNIFDDVTFSVHFTPSATDVNIKRPSNNWTYNTKLPTEDVNGVEKHYMEITLDGFDVNYDGFNRVMLQYKAASGSDDDWTTLMSYYNDQEACDRAILNGMNAEMIKSSDAGTITYRLFLDDLPDQNYDIRAVGTSIINDEEIYNYSDVHSGIKDMYNPRLFGSAQPANGVLTVNDEIRLNFNETIAEGLLTDKNFQVTGIRNGAQTDHSVSVRLDGENDVLTTEFSKNWHNKPLTVEMWILADKAQDAVLFSQGDANSAIELGITQSNNLKVKVGDKTIVSTKQFDFEQGTWAHVAMVYDGTNKVSAFYNYEELINAVETNGFDGEGTYTFGASIDGTQHFAGNMHNARIWDKELALNRLQTNSLTLLSGSESNLLAYYPMNEARGTMLTDKAHGNNLAINGSTWVVPEGRAVTLDGNQMLKISAGSTCVIDSSMDYTLELWFKAEEGQKNATIVSNGRGDGGDFNHSFNNFALGFDEDGRLAFSNNGTTATCTGNFADNNWHHASVAVNRTSGRAQIYIDGELNTYFDATDLGGLASAYINVGARSWSPDTVSTVTVDNYFKGQIDEFRLWKLYRSESIVSNSFTEQLEGTEKGLLAYYPFETYVTHQGIQEIVFTLDDAKVQSDASLIVPPIEVEGSSEVETSASAPVKGKGPVSNLLYDFVVNNDALIINLNEPYDRIEKTIVTFTVDGVRDLNGNEILSPITWSAYIDRNQLKWADKSLSIVKMVNEEKDFTVNAVNNGGSIQHYTVENMPSWLDVNPSSGTIDPVSSVSINFTIDPSLNIGTYDEVIYLRNDNNVVEPLQLTIKVEGEKPDWTVDPAKYKYNMSVFGKLKINNSYSADEEDILAVFKGSECLGVTTNKYYKVNDMYYAMLTIYGNDVKASGLEFRIWDASTGRTYIAQPDVDIAFENNSVIGSPAQPVVFTAKDLRVQNIALAEGWSWISVNVNSDKLNDLNTLLGANKWTSDDQVKSEEYGFASYSSSNGWVGSLSSINNKSMYLIHSSNAQALSVSGTPVDTKTTTLEILGAKEDGTPRWNYISYLPADNLTLKEALAGYDAVEGDIIKSQTDMAMYSGNLGWIGSLSYMESGKGYMLQRTANSNATLQYPSASAVTRSSSMDVAPTTAAAADVQRYATNMTAVARIEGIDVNEGDHLVAYSAGTKCGETTVSELPDGDKLFLIAIGGDTNHTIDVALERNGETLAQAPAVLTYQANNAIGTLDTPMVISFNNNKEGIYLYPTPFSDQLTIGTNTDADAKVDVYVTNVGGVRVAQWLNCNNGGHVEVVWNVEDGTPDGVYIVSVAINGTVQSVKAIKK